MKLKHLFFNALAVMAFAACSNEAEEIKPAEKATTATLELDMTGQYGGGSSDQTRALSLDGSEYPRFIHEEGVTDWKTHCFIRNEEGTVQFYALVDWNATTDADGNISLHIKNSTLTLQNSAGSDVSNTETLPKAGERWYIAGIAGGGIYDEATSSVSFGSNADLERSLSPYQSRIPLSFGWTRFTIPTNMQRAPQIVVQFQPQGSLVSVRVNNKTNLYGKALHAVVRVKSNALSHNGLFDYSLEATRSEYATSPKWVFTNETATTEDSYRQIHIDANTAANCYVWAMPRTTAPAEGFSTTVGLGGYDYFTEGSTSEKPAAITKAFQKGSTYMAQAVDVGRAYLPQEFITTHNVAPDGQSFMTHSGNAGSGYWNWTDAVAKFSNITIDGKGYHLPNMVEMRVLFPPYKSAPQYVNFNTTEVSQSPYQEAIYIDGLYLRTTSHFKTVGGITYAVRFGTPDGDYTRLTACRFARVANNMSPGLQKTVVTFRHLGVETSVDDVASEAYWQSNTENDVTIEIPISGRKNAAGVAENFGVISEYWSSSPASETTAWRAFGTSLMTGNIENQMTIRLFKNSVE